MVNNENNEQTLIEAKHELYRQLTNIIRPHLYEGLQSLYNNAVDENKYDNEHFYRFQISLRNIRQWNSNIIEEECIRIKDSANCDYLDELIVANFTTYAKILYFIRPSRKHIKLNVTVPKFDKFIHNCYIESAKIIFTDPKLFNHKLNDDLKQQNMVTILKHIDTGIESTIRIISPYKEILHETGMSIKDSIALIHDISFEEYVESYKNFAGDIDLDECLEEEGEYIDRWGSIVEQSVLSNILQCPIMVFNSQKYDKKLGKIVNGKIIKNKPEKDVRLKLSSMSGGKYMGKLPLFLIWREYHTHGHYLVCYPKDKSTINFVISDLIN